MRVCAEGDTVGDRRGICIFVALQATVLLLKTENTSDLTFWWNSTHKNLCRPCLTELKTNIYLYPKFWFSLWGQLFRAESIYIYGNYFELVMELALSSPL